VTGAIAGPVGTRRTARWVAATVIAVGAVLSQYVVPLRPSLPIVRYAYGHLVTDLAIVYLIPIVAFAVLVGAEPLRRWRREMHRATGAGLGWFAIASWVSIGVTIVLTIVYAIADPGALRLLTRENPAIAQAASDPWLFVALSFLVGACEEMIFRGWIFGTWARRTGRWLGPAIGSSAIFTGVHLYYGFAFGVASPFFYQDLFLLGFAFAATYHASGGNLLVPVALHGLSDALGFVSLVSLPAAVIARFGLILAASAVGAVYYVRHGGAAFTTPPAPLPGPA
jgi:membrane protease YdiL (CAAX protease family)